MTRTRFRRTFYLSIGNFDSLDPNILFDTKRLNIARVSLLEPPPPYSPASPAAQDRVVVDGKPSDVADDVPVSVDANPTVLASDPLITAAGANLLEDADPSEPRHEEPVTPPRIAELRREPLTPTESRGTYKRQSGTLSRPPKRFHAEGFFILF